MDTEEFNELLRRCSEKESRSNDMTPKNLFPNRSLADSGYSSLPDSPLKPLEEGKLGRKSLSLQFPDTPLKKKPYSRRTLYAESDDTYRIFTPNSSERCKYRRRSHSSPNLLDETPDYDDGARELLFPSPQLAFQGCTDMLSALKRYPSLAANVLSFLDERDLTAVCCVSREWNEICRSDRHANERRISFLQCSALNKENPMQQRGSAKIHPTRKNGGPMTPIFENRRLPPKVTQSLSADSFQKFVQAVQYLPEDGRLMKCIRCSSPSQVLPDSSRASCTEVSCSFEFCRHCLQQYSDHHICLRSYSSGSGVVCDGGNGNLSSTPSLRLGTKKSQKNLHRLRMS